MQRLVGRREGDIGGATLDGHSVALHRIDDADSSHPGMTADYLGTVEGGTMSKVTYSWPGHLLLKPGYGTGRERSIP
jgi:hypothetical protein